MTVRSKGIKTSRTSGNLGRRLPNTDGVAVLVMNGMAVSGGVQLSTTYELVSTNDLAALKIDAAYDSTNNVLVYHHIKRAFLRNPNLKLYIMVVPQKVSTTHITPDKICDKTQSYLLKCLNDVRNTFKANPKLIGVVFNPHSTYTATITAGIDATGAAAKAKLDELLNDQVDSYRFVSAFLEARSFSGTVSDLVAVEALSSNLASPRISFVIAADPAISATAAFAGYAAIGDALGVFSIASISENVGNPIPKFNLTNSANNAFVTAGLSGAQALPTDNATLNSLETKGYIFAETIEGVDGIYFNDTRTCVAVSDDYAYVENNRTIDKALLSIRTALLPLITNAKLKVDTTSGELSLSQKSLIEDAANSSLAPMERDGDISGGISCVIPSGINVLAGEEIIIQATFVPVAIGRAVTVKAGFTNPFKA
jgi:hypothetical protein